jgi:hypothetical protein
MYVFCTLPDYKKKKKQNTKKKKTEILPEDFLKSFRDFKKTGKT